MKILTRLIILFLLLIVIPFQLTHLYLKDKTYIGQVAGLKTQQETVIVNAFVGEYHFTLFGYTSPQAIVTLNGQGISDQAYADASGYFEFSNRFSPLSPREACLSVKDQFGRLSSPLCLPSFPVNYNAIIGPVIMPPTISLNNPPVGGDYFMGDEVILSGQTVPNTKVNLSIFGDNRNKFEARNTKFETNSNFKIRILKIISDFALIRPVEAFTFPQLNTMSDSKGNFSINLPSSNPEKFRLFAQTDFKKSISANSVKLNLEILPVWIIIRLRLLEIVIISEIIVILSFLKEYFQKKTIVLYKSRLPTIKEEKSLLLVD